MRRHAFDRAPPRVPLLFVVLLLAGAACGGAQKNQDGEETSESTIVGAPPSEDEDPFRVAETPEVAERAESEGYIGEEDSGEETSGGDERADSKRDESSESSRVAVRASEAEPTDEEKGSESKSEVRCFSCVRICPIETGGEASCKGGERDVICGWGVHEDSQMASKLARAECDGALDMARTMKQWSRIEGKCPPAECR